MTLFAKETLDGIKECILEEIQVATGSCTCMNCGSEVYANHRFRINECDPYDGKFISYGLAHNDCAKPLSDYEPTMTHNETATGDKYQAATLGQTFAGEKNNLASKSGQD